jgi:transcriptional antiterminator RfaH
MDKAQGVESARWYLVQSKPRQAQRAEINLMRQGYVVYHPRILLERVRRGKRHAVEDSLFTNYLFIRLRRWIDDWSPLRSTFGVCRLVSFGTEPLSVPHTPIEAIRQRLAAAPVQPVFQPGQDLRVSAGVFNGLDAIFEAYDGVDRARLLIQMLGRQTEVVLPLASLARSA